MISLAEANRMADRDGPDWYLAHRKPSAMRLLYHAFEQGVHAGLVGFDHRKDCPYKTPDYRCWWMHGCIVGGNYRDLRIAGIAEAKAHDECLAENEALRSKLTTAERERDEARRAILACGNGQDFDWNVLGRVEEAESKLTAIRDLLNAPMHRGDRYGVILRVAAIVEGRSDVPT